MASGFAAWMRREKTAERDGFLEPALVVSIAIAIFAVVTQCLAATGAISLSATQQLTMWLVAAGLIVLLWIAYMTVKAQAETVKAQARMAEAVERAGAGAEREAAAAREAAKEQVARAEREAAAAREAAKEQVTRAEREAAAAREAAKEQVTRAERAAEEWVARAQRERDNTVASAESRATEAESGDAWVPPDKLRRLDGSKQSVNTADVFPNGCYLVPGSISETQDYEETTGTRLRVYQCQVVDRNPALEGRSRETVVQILADQTPVPPTGLQFEPVKFEDLQVTPYVTDKGQMGFLLRSKGIEPTVSLATTHTEDGRDGRR
jgi:hypothetical protein